MDVHLFARIKTMLAEVAELRPPTGRSFSTRRAVTTRACAARLRPCSPGSDLLPSVLQSGQLDAPLIAALDEIVAAPTDPERVGPYTVQSLLGRGGMGVVYRATQQAPLQREVALKLVRPGPSPADVLARFEAERQTLSRLAHPAIATVFDAGTPPTGARTSRWNSSTACR
jgi:eukaryotic-like serine/threonine-protein kinase